MHAATRGFAKEKNDQRRIDQKHILYRVILFLATVTFGLFSRALVHFSTEGEVTPTPDCYAMTGLATDGIRAGGGTLGACMAERRRQRRDGNGDDECQAGTVREVHSAQVGGARSRT